MTAELYKTEIQLQAILDELIVPLGEMLEWKVGSQIMLNAQPNDEVELRCGDFPMFRGPVGQKQEHLAVRIEKYIEKEQDEEQ